MEGWERSKRRIVLGADHAGFALKEAIKKALTSSGIEVIDVGTTGSESVDYPDFAEKVADGVSAGRFREGILVCGTGIGMSITANKYPGVRAAVAPNVFMAKASRAHNDSNVLCLGSRVIDESTAIDVVNAWLGEKFEGGRHSRRLEKITELDRGIVPPRRTGEEPS